MRANQLRLWFASFAYVLLAALRRIGLRHTQFAAAACGTIRLKLLKIGAHWPPGWGTGPQPRSGGQSQERAPDQARHGLGLPVPGRVPPRLPLPAPRRRLLSAPAYPRRTLKIRRHHCKCAPSAAELSQPALDRQTASRPYRL